MLFNRKRLTSLFRVSFTIPLLLIVLNPLPVKAWWQEGQVIVTSTQDAYPANPKATALSRNRDRRLTNSFFHQTGADIFLGYNLVNFKDPRSTSLWVKMFVHNQTPEHHSCWSEPVRVSPRIDTLTVISHSLTSAYIRPDHYVCKLPAVYIAYITQDTVRSECTLHVAQYLADHKDARVYLTANPLFDFQIPAPGGWTMNSIEISRAEIMSAYGSREALHICWEEQEISSGKRRILIADVPSDGKAGNPNILADGIESLSELAPAFDTVSLRHGRVNGSIILRGIVCWNQQYEKDGQKTGQIHVAGYQMTPSGQAFSRLGPVMPVGTDTDKTITTHADVHITYERYNRGAAIITWQTNSPETTTKQIKARTVWFDSPHDTARLFIFEDTDCVLCQTPRTDLVATVIDNAFCQPQSIDFDPQQSRLIYCDTGNHRVGQVMDPTPELPGCWFAEYQVSNGYDFRSVGELTRYTGEDTNPYHEIGQQICTVNASSTGADITYRSYNTAFQPVNSRPIGTANKVVNAKRLNSLQLVSDTFSSLYLFYTLSDPIKKHQIYWNSDTLKTMINMDQPPRFYRFTYPYDISIIPPHPKNNRLKQSGQRAQAGFWIADMGGNRLVKLNHDGEIVSMTQSEMVVAPHAVSAAWDGSCWAIDWGRETLIKVDTSGNVVARSRRCMPGFDSSDCLIHPSALACGGDPDICFVADYEGNAVFKVTLESDQFRLTRSNVDYFRPSALEIVPTSTEVIVWVADHASLQSPPVEGIWTPVVLPTTSPSPPPGQRFTPVPPTPVPETYRVSRNVFGDHQLQEWPAAAPMAIAPMGTRHCWIADRDAGSYMRNEVCWVSPEGQISIDGNASHTISMPVDVENVMPRNQQTENAE